MSVANAGSREGAEAPGIATGAGVSGMEHGLLCLGGEWKVPVSFSSHHIFNVTSSSSSILTHLLQQGEHCTSSPIFSDARVYCTTTAATLVTSLNKKRKMYHKSVRKDWIDSTHTHPHIASGEQLAK